MLEKSSFSTSKWHMIRNTNTSHIVSSQNEMHRFETHNRGEKNNGRSYTGIYFKISLFTVTFFKQRRGKMALKKA